MKLWKRLADFCSGYYSLLLIFLFFLFILRPYNFGFVYLAIWKGCLTIVLFLSIFNCKHHKNVRITAIILGIPTFLMTWGNLFDKGSTMRIINAALAVLFITCITTSVLHDVIKRARVTMETLRGVICAYFMIAFAFAYLYCLIELLIPGSIHFATRDVSIQSYAQFLSEMLYFSFITLLTIGYGDVTAVLDVGQTVAVIEGIIGQFYIAILVARLVSVYSFYSDKTLLKNIEKDIKNARK